MTLRAILERDMRVVWAEYEQQLRIQRMIAYLEKNPPTFKITIFDI